MPLTPEEEDASTKSHISKLTAQLEAIEGPPKRRFRDTAESIGGCLMMAAFAALPIILLIAFVKSIGWVIEVLLPILAWTSGIGLLLVPIFLLLAIPRITRGWAGLGITLSSYALGLSLWTWSLVIAYAIAGVGWIVVGLFLAGVGVVAVAAFASALHGEWFVFFQIVIGVIIVALICRFR